MPSLKLHNPSASPTRFDLVRLQDNIRSYIDSFLDCPFLSGLWIEDVSVPAWPATIQVAHGLGRVPLGVLVVSSASSPSETDGVYASNMTSSELTIQRSIAVAITVNLWVF